MLSSLSTKYLGSRWYISDFDPDVLDGTFSILIGAFDLCNGGSVRAYRGRKERLGD